eukprot:103548_1
MDHYGETYTIGQTSEATYVLAKDEEEMGSQMMTLVVSITMMAFICALVVIVVQVREAIVDNLPCLRDHEGNLLQLWHIIVSVNEEEAMRIAKMDGMCAVRHGLREYNTYDAR